MRTGMTIAITLLLAALSFELVAFEKSVRMPPRFKLDATPQDVLSIYPLGVIDKQAAFSHHGGTHRKVTLPNGMEGWLYHVGEQQWHRSYTLVFDINNKVSDILYYDHGKNREYGLSAMQIQSLDMIVGGTRLGSGPDRQ